MMLFEIFADTVAVAAGAGDGDALSSSLTRPKRCWGRGSSRGSGESGGGPMLGQPCARTGRGEALWYRVERYERLIG